MSVDTERDPLWEQSVLASELERISVTPAGLVHWLVVDVASGIASANGQAEEAALLRELPTPNGRASPAGVNEVLDRIYERSQCLMIDEERSLHLEIEERNETHKRQRLGAAVDRPGWLDVALAATSTTGVWVGAVRRARSALFNAHRVAAVRDRQEELRGIPVDDGGWMSTWLTSVEMDLWDHARELTFWPLTVGDDPGSKDGMGLIVGRNPRWWPDDAQLESGA